MRSRIDPPSCRIGAPGFRGARVANEAESRGQFGSKNAAEWHPLPRAGEPSARVRLVNAFTCRQEVPIIEIADAGSRREDQRTPFVAPRATEAARGPIALVDQSLAVEVKHEWSAGKAHVDALRSILKKPAPVGIPRVVAADETAQRSIANAAELGGRGIA